MALSADAKKRKDTPMARGLLDYFPDACAAVAELSRIGNEQHQPGEPMHWAREKSTDHADCIVRHLVDRGTVDSDGVRHSVKVAWRALALVQTEIEAAAAQADIPQRDSEGLRKDHPSRWLMQDLDGHEWETVNEYTYVDVEKSFGATPILRLPAFDTATCGGGDASNGYFTHPAACPCYTCAKARRDRTGQWE